MADEEQKPIQHKDWILPLSLSVALSVPKISSAALSASEHLFPSLIERCKSQAPSVPASSASTNSGKGELRSMDDGGFLELLGAREEDGGGFLLCFGRAEEDGGLLPLQGVLLSRRSADNSSISSLSSCPPSTINDGGGGGNCLKTPKKEVGAGGGGGAGRRSPRVTTTAKAAIKKPKTEGSASAGHGSSSKAASKEKLGDRIVALQQLVCPFGKSDTASVLLEALGYIRFLHDQIQVLSSPYLQSLPFADHHIQDGGENDLRRYGLCLVPVSCTEHVTGSNGADLWSPGLGMWSSSSGGRSKSSSCSKSNSNSKH